jgi:hypothetical protein
MIMASKRFSLEAVSLLSKAVCGVSRLAGAVISPGNYGSFTQTSALSIPANNVGTVVSLPSALDNYLYVDIEIFGGIAGVTASGPTVQCPLVGGLKLVQSKTYIIRVPYCGPIETFTFSLTSYVVRKITAVFAPMYLLSAVSDVTKFAGVDSGGTKYAKLQVYATSGSTLNIPFNNYTPGIDAIFNILPISGYTGVMQISVLTEFGMPFTENGYIFYDGVGTLSGFINGDLTICIPDNASDFTQFGYVLFTNPLVEQVALLISPKVRSFSPIATAYGTA